ncbi:MAG: hypothetical protein LUO93_08925, partial [Methanomicrobiales archaeon]|nr:hypothetical protein [Methanomicrobiales archaeon]
MLHDFAYDCGSSRSARHVGRLPARSEVAPILRVGGREWRKWDSGSWGRACGGRRMRGCMRRIRGR